MVFVVSPKLDRSPLADPPGNEISSDCPPLDIGRESTIVLGV